MGWSDSSFDTWIAQIADSGIRPTSMAWAHRLKRDFGIDIETCPACGEAVRFIAYIAKMSTHLDRKGAELEANRWLPSLVTDITAINTQTNLLPGRIRTPQYGSFRNSPFRARGRQHVPRHAPAREAGAVERKRLLYCLYARSGRRRWPRGSSSISHGSRRSQS